MSSQYSNKPLSLDDLLDQSSISSLSQGSEKYQSMLATVIDQKINNEVIIRDKNIKFQKMRQENLQILKELNQYKQKNKELQEEKESYYDLIQTNNDYFNYQTQKYQQDIAKIKKQLEVQSKKSQNLKFQIKIFNQKLKDQIRSQEAGQLLERLEKANNQIWILKSQSKFYKQQFQKKKDQIEALLQQISEVKRSNQLLKKQNEQIIIQDKNILVSTRSSQINQEMLAYLSQDDCQYLHKNKLELESK